MKKAAYRYRIYPTPTQKIELSRLFGCVRFAYNWGLACGLKALEIGEPLPTYYDLSAALTQLKRTEGYTWLKSVSCIPVQQTLRHLTQAWKRCFAKLSGRPKFKRKQGKQSAEFTKSGIQIDNQTIKLGKITGHLNIRWSRELPCAPSSCTVTLDRAGRYHISFVVEIEPDPLTSNSQSIGIDLGLTHFAVTSDGVKFNNPKFLKRDLEKLAKAQRKYARTQRGSKNREKARQKIAKIHARIADKRRDHLHKLSTQLISENQALAVESLAVKHMINNHRLAKSINDAGWGMFVRMLEYKAQWYGRQLIKIDRWTPTSKMCNTCEHTVASLPLNIRQWTCENCGTTHDRDINAAINIKRAAGLVDLFHKNARGEETNGAKQLSLI